jgi:hypothetical protein
MIVTITMETTTNPKFTANIRAGTHTLKGQKAPAIREGDRGLQNKK